jgi:molecular chaperone GrpE
MSQEEPTFLRWSWKSLRPKKHGELEALRAERDEMRDKFMRVLADAENSRKRAERDRKEAEMYGGTRLARDLLPVYDNLNRAIQAIPEESRAASAALIEGVELTLRELTNVMTKHGITMIRRSRGRCSTRSCIRRCSRPRCLGRRPGRSSRWRPRASFCYDRLLRPAQVGVSSNPG